MKIAIIQSCYLPWKGYFDIIKDVDTFVFLDTVQLTKRDWRTRNIIKSSSGPSWLTVPVHGGRAQRICDAKIVQDNWQKKHLKTLLHNYSNSKYFSYFPKLIDWLYNTPHSDLSTFNQTTIKMICTILGIEVQFRNALELIHSEHKDNLIVSICRQLGAKEYISGPSANNYIEASKFNSANIGLKFKDYSKYPEYPQLFPPFIHNVSILDLLFNCGPESGSYIWGNK